MGYGIGQAARRTQDQRFLRGVGSYVTDLNLPRQACGAAVSAAPAPLGVTHIDMPLTPCRVWEAIRAARGRGA
ncbi:MAG: hypothetical protein JWN93_3866 [Hyphomicrobiales bacterium]|jgi:carbon-monoxide dehydrogenase large subunit|nr:hypothetical protein [Hyphomicrobiales bacterium]